MPWINYRELREHLEIEVMLSWMGWQATQRTGPYLRGMCPFCSDSETGNPRVFVAHINRHIFKCHCCGRGGDVLNLWATFRGTSLNEAASELYHMVHEQPKSTSSNPPSHPRQPPT